MLRFLGPSRREWLRIGTLGGLSLALRPATASSLAPGFGRARSVLVVFASGGQSQIDTWDPKPNAPAEVRGEFTSIATALPGVRFCEHMPKLAKRADRFTVIRSMSHDDLDHGSAAYASLTGHFHPRKSSNPPPTPTDFPTLGAIVRRLRPNSDVPYPAVHLNGPLLVPDVVGPGQYGGILGRAHEPLTLADVRDAAEVRDLTPRDDLSSARVQRRRGLLKGMPLKALEGAALDLDVRQKQAYELLSSSAKSAFDLNQEPLKLRERYGMHRSGQACLLARRLVEAGVPYINVFFNPSIRGQDKEPESTDAYGWDTHNDIFESLKDHLLPRFDATVSVLLDDLEQRGLLETTLVVCMGEFGRAPLVALEPKFAGSTPGRKHWGACYSIVMAGAGVVRGKILGASDRQGAYPTTLAYTPGDVAATMFSALGIDPKSQYRDALDRPFVVSEGRVIRGAYEEGPK